MRHLAGSPVVHLELHTGNLSAARDFYASLLGWRAETIAVGAASYEAIEMGDGVGGGIVDCGAERPVWLPYVAVPDIRAVTERARALGAGVPLPPREGPAGWRAVIASPDGTEVGLWQPKEQAGR